MENLVTGPDFWRGKRVFVTGHTGFKGTWLLFLLSAWGAEVHGYALAPEAESLFRAARGDARVARSTIGDLADRAALEAALIAARADIVIHLAAQPLVRASYDDPVGTYLVNVMGTAHLLDALRRSPGTRAALCVTSDKAYENREWLWGYRETEAMGGHDPYSSSKGCAELVVSAFRRSYFSGDACRIATARAGNVIGGGDWAPNRLVPDLVRDAIGGRATAIRHPGSIRPWQHVLEAVAGYLQLCERLFGDAGESYAEGWNFGPAPNAERTVGDVADGFCRRWGAPARWESQPDPRLHEAHYLKLDSAKANSRLNWLPVWSFEETLDETVSWYRHHSDACDMDAFTERQAAAYLARRQEHHESGR